MGKVDGKGGGRESSNGKCRRCRKGVRVLEEGEVEGREGEGEWSVKGEGERL